MKKETNIWEDAARMAKKDNPLPRPSSRWRWWDNFFSLELPEYPENRAYAPPYDISETESYYWMRLDLPGLELSNIKVNVLGGELRISGERKGNANDRNFFYSRTKPRYGKFKRSFALPINIDTESIKASYQNGVLGLFLPKRMNFQGHQIEISDHWEFPLEFPPEKLTLQTDLSSEPSFPADLVQDLRDQTEQKEPVDKEKAA